MPATLRKNPAKPAAAAPPIVGGTPQTVLVMTVWFDTRADTFTNIERLIDHAREDGEVRSALVTVPGTTFDLC